MMPKKQFAASPVGNAAASILSPAVAVVALPYAGINQIRFKGLPE